MVFSVRRRSTFSCPALGFAALSFVLLAGSSEAQVVYAPAQLYPLGVPYDEAAGTSPSFQINRGGYDGQPRVRVVETCQYPDGWNVTDFSRDVNGTPGGLEHACRTGGGVRARY